ncbi:hypothetical protein JHW43_006162 [Diplocarpon mali]|nr:hypothetical protein JHW43_006162 [Diplocarpon mali]
MRTSPLLFLALLWPVLAHPHVSNPQQQHSSKFEREPEIEDLYAYRPEERPLHTTSPHPDNRTPIEMATPSDPPPPYSASPAPQTQPSASSHLRVPNPRNGIPPLSRRSMEDEARDLPHGWTRQYDQSSHHQFFVNTLSHPPRSIWHHPYDDDEYLASLTPEERARVQGLHRVPSEADIRAESSDEEDHDDDHATLPPRGESAGAEDSPKGVHKLGRKMKDKLTASTHTEREASRRQRAQEEAAAYERHQHIRRQMSRALETGEPQLLGKDRNGKDVYIEPPQMPRGYAGYGAGGYGYNPYMQGPFGMGMGVGGVRYARPAGPYARPYGGGYGGGLGAPLLGGLAGGALLGGLLF